MNDQEKIDLLHSDFSNVNPNEIPRLIANLNKMRDEYFDKRQFNNAILADQQCDNLRSISIQKAKHDAATSRQQELQKRLEKAIEFQQKLESQYDKIIEEITTDGNARLEYLISEHSRQEEELIQSWQTPQKTRSFSRASSQLAEMRLKTVRLMGAGRYDELQPLEKAIQERENYETDENYREMTLRLDAQIQKLQERQQVEIESLQIANESRISTYKSQRQKDLDQIQQRIDKLNRLIRESKDETKIWNLYHRNNHTPVTWRSAQTHQKRKKMSVNMS